MRALFLPQPKFADVKELTYFKKIRLRMDLSQEEMADRMGISRTAYVKLENGRTRIITGSVLGFAEATGIPLAEIIAGCIPEAAGNRLGDGGGCEEKIRTLTDEYERRLEHKDGIIAEKQKIIDSQDETIRVQKQMIAMYERKSAGNS